MNYPSFGINTKPVAKSKYLTQGDRIISNSKIPGALKFQVFPNPTSNELHIKIPNWSGSQKRWIKIMDQQGKVWLIKHIKTTESIDVSNLSQGLYKIIVHGQGQTMQQLFSKL